MNHVDKKDTMRLMAELFDGDHEVQASTCLALALDRQDRTAKRTVALYCRSKARQRELIAAFEESKALGINVAMEIAKDEEDKLRAKSSSPVEDVQTKPDGCLPMKQEETQ